MPERDSLEARAARLLSSTEALHAALVDNPSTSTSTSTSTSPSPSTSPSTSDEASAEGAGAAWAERVAAFDALREAIEAGDRVGPAVRACVERVRELDAELLDHGARITSAIQTERQALGRKRAVIQAHATRERPEPRAIVVKA